MDLMKQCWENAKSPTAKTYIHTNTLCFTNVVHYANITRNVLACNQSNVYSVHIIRQCQKP